MARPKSIKEPKFVSGISAGWSDSANRWLTREGKFTTKSKAIELNATADPDGFGGYVKTKRFPTPISTNFEILETAMFNGETDAPMSGTAGVIKAIAENVKTYSNNMQASYDVGVKQWEKDQGNKMRAVQGFDKVPEDKPMPNYMPTQIQTRLNLAEHYYNTDGDVANVVDVPVELLSRKIDVICSDKKLRAEIEAFLNGKNIEAIISELWSVTREYGQAYPYEVWDDPDNPKDLIDIVPLPPKSVHIGYNWAYGLSANYAGANAWTESLLRAVFPPAMFRILQRHWDDSPMYDIPATGVLLHGDFLKPIFDKRRSWIRYSMPMVSRGFRELVDRTVYEDSVRALVEGYKYQLWVIKVGDADHPPLPQEINAVKSMLGDISGDRTGMLVWRDSPFVVEVHVPKGLQEMISNDYHGGLTKQFLRKMGVTSQVIDGETPGTLGSSGGRGAAASKGDIDVQIYYERARYQAKQVLDWLTYLVKKWVKYNSAGKKLSVKALDNLSFQFAPTYVEMAGRIAEIYGPMYRDGALSHRTYVGAAGLNGDIELDYKEDEIPARDKGLLNPPVSFAQMVVNPQGETKTVEQTEPQGSPDKAQEQNNAAQKRGVMTAEEMLERIESRQPIVNVTVPPPPQTIVNNTLPENRTQIDVHVPKQDVPNITVEAAQAPEVTVNIPKQDQPKIIVQPAAVNVAPPPVNVDVHVPQQATPNVTVEAPHVTVEAAQINVPEQPAPVVNVAAPNVTVEAAQVTIPKPDATVVNVTLPEMNPTINVEAPEVTVTNEVNPTPVTVENQVNLPERKERDIRFNYDANGNIIGLKG